MRVYLAGPDVFQRDAKALGAAKREICARHGLIGCFPLDNDLAPGRGLARRIYDANIAMMEGCDAIIANLTPFRGPNADDGTAFELGWFAARGRPMMAYLNDPRLLFERTTSTDGWDAEDQLVENFGWPLNLMLIASVEAAGGSVIRGAGKGDPRRDLTAFEDCVSALAKRLSLSSSLSS
jgi:nucleoside 2-deoxyribosyltransferase